MGYDLYGTAPTAAEGKHFRRAIIHWPLIAELCINLAGEETRDCKDWYGVEAYGNGLNAERSIKLADRLEKLLSDGSVARWIAEMKADDLEGWKEHDWVEEEDIREFSEFLRACGGFTIS